MSQPALTGVVVDAPGAIKIFGRNPSVFLGVIEAALVLLVAFSLGVTNESAGLISAAISLGIGAYSAWATQDTSLGVWTGVVKAGLALFVYYGVHLTPDQIVSIVAFAPILVGAFQRTQTSPTAFPVDPDPVQVADSPVSLPAPAPGGPDAD